MPQKKTRKLLKKVLNTPNKRALYSASELIYIERMYKLIEANHKKRKQLKKGFSTNNHE